jgi:hypothetical protein
MSCEVHFPSQASWGCRSRSRRCSCCSSSWRHATPLSRAPCSSHSSLAAQSRQPRLVISRQMDVLAMAEALAAIAARPVDELCGNIWWTTPQLKGCRQQHLPGSSIGRSRRVWQPRFLLPALGMGFAAVLAASIQPRAEAPEQSVAQHRLTAANHGTAAAMIRHQQHQLCQWLIWRRQSLCWQCSRSTSSAALDSGDMQHSPVPTRRHSSSRQTRASGTRTPGSPTGSRTWSSPLAALCWTWRHHSPQSSTASPSPTAATARWRMLSPPNLPLKGQQTAGRQGDGDVRSNWDVCHRLRYGCAHQLQGSGSVLATAGLHLLPQLAAAFPQYHTAAGGAAAKPPQPAAAPQGGLAAGGAPNGWAALRPGEPVGEYLQCAAATEAAATLGLKAS